MRPKSRTGGGTDAAKEKRASARPIAAAPQQIFWKRDRQRRTLTAAAHSFAARDIAEIFQQYRSWDDPAALQHAQFAPRGNLGLGLHCHHKHDVVEHLALNFAPPQAEPLAYLKLLNMAAALVKSHLSEIVVLRLDLDRYRAFAVGLCDVLVRQFLKICIFENFVQGSNSDRHRRNRSLRGQPRRGLRSQD